jgi:tetratricopeptide (TPR) repeat protein
MKKIVLLISSIALAQQPDGYWDKERITSKEIILKAGERTIIKSEDLPVGTTEFVYRITLLDKNQQLASDLSSVLKAIPDPFYIGKGAGGAISLVSTISGSDTCTYAIFSDATKSNDYSKTGNIKAACYFQNDKISKDAKVISLEKNKCLNDDSATVWFGFENKNWLLGEKIVLEIVPWVDIKASKIWNATNKKIGFNYIKSSEVASKLTNAEGFCYNVLEKIQNDYKFSAFQKLSGTEKNAIIDQFATKALVETNNSENYSKTIRAEALTMAKTGKYDNAIKLINDRLIGKEQKSALNYNILAEMYIFTKQYQKALKSLENAQKIDPSELLVQLNLAHTYMFLGKMKESKEIHKKFMEQNVTTTMSWKTKLRFDFEDFKKLNLPLDNVNKIMRLID